MMSTSNHQPAISSTGEEQTPKERKPYTISKQREKWTEEEHGRFLEALKLHGRAWRKIEEHIGTKTTVQIRSHAQKFFSKVIREATSGDSKAMNPTDIPPPRPKRKPLHPYPRKSGSMTNRSLPTLKKLDKCSSINDCSSDQDNRSPTSVLSTVVSDMIGESSSNVPTQDSYHGRLEPAAHPPSQKLNGSNSQQPSVQGDAESSPTTEEKSDVEVDTCTMENGTPTTSLKLFGRTVVVSDAHKPSSCIMTSVEQCNKLELRTWLHPLNLAPGCPNEEMQKEEGRLAVSFERGTGCRRMGGINECKPQSIEGEGKGIHALQKKLNRKSRTV